MKKILQGIFSVRSVGAHRVVTILGLKIKFRSLTNIIREEVSYICAREVYSALCVSKLHSKVFPKYKNCYANKTIVIVGCGPSIRYYDNQIKVAINIALNDAIFFREFKYDFLFNWDTGVEKRIANWYNLAKNISCTKLYGHCLTEVCASPKEEYDDQKNNIEHFYYSARHNWPAWNFGEVIHSDLSIYPLMDFGSIAFGALSFALYTRPQKIYLIGLDTTMSGHVLGNNYKCTYDTERMFRGYVKFKEFINTYYNDTEIISVNPVGLKGLFRDVYTQSYVDEHPELLSENIEILEKVVC